MKLSMLGHDYRYEFAPVGRSVERPYSTYIRANGKGVVPGIAGSCLGQVTAAQDPDLYAATQAYMARNPGKWPTSAADSLVRSIASQYGVDADPLYRNLMLEKSAARTEALQRGLDTATKISEALTKGAISIAEAYTAIKGLTGEEKQKAETQVRTYQMQQYLPWMIGAGALLVGVMLIAGTRRQRRTYRYR